MKLQNTFVGGKMNKDIDERLLPKGQYFHAENIMVANTEKSDMGAVENVRGNYRLSDLGLVNGRTIGAFSSGSHQCIYWFVTSDTKDMVLEYNYLTGDTERLLESSRPGVLNFSADNLITGVVRIVSGDVNKDLIAWTDDRNPPRIINIVRAKTYTVDGFDEDDISLIKKPPRYAPTTALTFTSSTLENNLENKFVSFSTRYKYLDGDYSALSSFTNYAFAPSPFDLDFQTMENNGMANSFNAVNVGFNTGSKNVVSIDLVMKESNSNTIWLVDSFDKSELGWPDDVSRSFIFSNNKKLTPLPSEELFRTFDNVPRLAKAMDFVGSRLMFGNFVEQYDLKDVNGDDINIDFTVDMINSQLTGRNIPVTITTTTFTSDTIDINLSGVPLKKGNRLIVDVMVVEDIYSGRFTGSSSFILNRDYTNASDLSSDEDFKYFVEGVMTGLFSAGYTLDLPEEADILSIDGYEILTGTSSIVKIKSPKVNFQVSPNPPAVAVFHFDTDTSATYKEVAVDSSLKTNRSYEVGIVYMDKYNRSTTVLTSKTNTKYIPLEFSTYQNRLTVDITHNPPSWADRYKLVLKQDRGNYQTIYVNLFYQDGLYRWVRVEGANVDKIRAGDTLIVKSDLGGPVSDLTKIRVLELTNQPSDFIDGGEETGEEFIEEAGLYMKIKPTGVDMNFDESTIQVFEGFRHERYARNVYTEPIFGTMVGTTFTPFPINAGTRVSIYIHFKQRGSGAYDAVYDQTYRVNGNYANMKAWFDAEVVDLGSFGENYTWGGNGYGFNPDGSQFYVRAYKDGTASRNVTTHVKFEVMNSDGIIIFETEPDEVDNDIFYETEQTFDIIGGMHQGNVRNQTSMLSAKVDMDAFNCYAQGNGAESYRYKDALTTGTDSTGKTILANYLNIDLRPSAVSEEKYREVRRFAGITYSEPYNDSANLNGLNNFNLAKANYKEDIDNKFGFIQKMYARDTNLMLFQEDKVSQILYGKDILTNADGTTNLAAIEDVLGQQVPYAGEWGISRNPESFAYDGNYVYFNDVKRGAVCRWSNNGIVEISRQGMRTWFKDRFKDDIDTFRFGAYDPYLDQYVTNLTEGGQYYTLTHDELVEGWTSFHTFNPEYMVGMNNKFYSFKGGDLYEHHSDLVPRGQFYGVDSPSKISLVINDSPSEVKELHAVMLEGNNTWKTLIRAYISNTDDFTKTTVKEIEFEKLEGMWYAYARREEDLSYNAASSYGIGTVIGIVGNVVTFNGGNSSLCEGDTLVKGSDLSVVGEIDSVTLNTVTVSSLGTLAEGDFILGIKDSRVEGSNLRGYSFKLDLETSKTTKVELFAVNIEVAKSYT